MLNTIYRLTQPRKFEIAFSDIDIFSGDIIALGDERLFYEGGTR